MWQDCGPRRSGTRIVHAGIEVLCIDCTRMAQSRSDGYKSWAIRVFPPETCVWIHDHRVAALRSTANWNKTRSCTIRGLLQSDARIALRRPQILGKSTAFARDLFPDSRALCGTIAVHDEAEQNSVMQESRFRLASALGCANRAQTATNLGQFQCVRTGLVWGFTLTVWQDSG